MTRALFLLGHLVTTPAALDLMERRGINGEVLIRRHVSGDWGDIHPDDQGPNEEALQDGGRIFSVYGKQDGATDNRLWVITEADRSATTILRPEDY